LCLQRKSTGIFFHNNIAWEIFLIKIIQKNFCQTTQKRIFQEDFARRIFARIFNENIYPKM